MSATTDHGFPNRLRAIRKECGLTLRDVDQETGIAFTNIGKIEKGERDLKSSHMALFSRVYGVCAADLLALEDGGLAPEERYLIDTYRDLPACLKQTFDALVASFQELRGKAIS